MNFRDLSDTDLMSFALAVETGLSGHKVTAFDNALADELAAAIAAINAAYQTSIKNAFVAETVKQAAMAAKRDDREREEAQLSLILSFLKANRAPAGDYEMLGFKAPRPAASRYIARDPDELAAVGASNGVNMLRFKGNNTPGRVKYQIWRRDGLEGEWALIDFSSQQRYVDDPVVPGQRYEYKIRAQAARSISNFSNMAVVYETP